MRIAVSGKGGTGKSTVLTMLADMLARAGKKPLLVVDADPNSTMPEMLGLEVDRTISEIREESATGKDIPAGMSRFDFFEQALEESIQEGEDVDLVVMGRPEGPGCYCSANNMLRMFLDRLANRYPYVLMDNEAGMEHLSRRTTNDVDLLLVVADCSRASLEAAKRIVELTETLPIKIQRKGLVLNRVPDEIPKIVTDFVEGIAIPLVSKLPNDEKLVEISFSGKPLYGNLNGSVAAQRLREDVGPLVGI